MFACDLIYRELIIIHTHNFILKLKRGLIECLQLFYRLLIAILMCIVLFICLYFIGAGDSSL